MLLLSDLGVVVGVRARFEIKGELELQAAKPGGRAGLEANLGQHEVPGIKRKGGPCIHHRREK